MLKQLTFMTMLITMIMMVSCGKKTTHENPFFEEFSTPFGVPPFDLIKNEHFVPAFEEGMKRHKAEIQIIIDNSDEPTFENTIVAYDNTGEMLKRVMGVFYNLTSSNTSPELQEIAKDLAPQISSHYDDISMNVDLFNKIKQVYENRITFDLNTEQNMLLDLIYKSFVRSGALLSEDDKAILRNINQELSILTLQFGDNLLAENNNFMLVIDNENDLSGLPEAVIEAAAETAKSNDLEGKWVFTLHNPSVMPFLQYADNRELRKQIQQAYINRGNNNNENDNKEIIKKIVALRIQRAQLLGYDSHADFVLEMNMAETSDNVYNLLNQLWKPAMKRAQDELKAYSLIAKKEGNKEPIQGWDWRYYAEKHRKEQYELDEEELKPYFSLNGVKDGIFYLCNTLFDIQFVPNNTLPTYHEDALAYEVRTNDNKHIGILYMDFHPRESKRGGAWFNSFRKQHRKDGEFITPIASIVCNFTKPTATQPSLLTLDEVGTFFHEFGHALHGLLSNGSYYSLTGTSVPRDFVELPSQILEHWATEPEMLRQYAKHYETNKIIPDELIEKIQNSAYFDQGFVTSEFLASAYLDMYWHTMSDISKLDLVKDPVSFENASLQSMGLIPEIYARHRSTYFAHVFSGGYSAGYYSYIWSALLDNDAFMAFKENGIFDKATADSFRTNILEKGHSDHPKNLYRAFRGKDPEIDALLIKRGLK
jgi:peptidyl-dipeptidase Dcp